MPPDSKGQPARAVFLDRDGVIIEDSGYVGEISRVNFLPLVGQAIRQLNAAGFKVIIVTNQAGVARGFFREEDVHRVNDYVCGKLAEENAVIDAVYYCPHHIEAVIEEYRKDCNCRKPKTGMIENAARDFNLDIKKSFLIGDSAKDIEAGRRAGCRTIMINNTGNGHRINAHYTARSLVDAVRWILEFNEGKNKKN